MRAALCAVLFLAVACDDGQTCETRSANLGEVCVPASLAPDLGPVIDVKEACGPFCSGPPTCSAKFLNGHIILETEQELCTSALVPACVDQGCRQLTIRCTLPALPAGDYTLDVPGGPPRSLHFAPGGVGSCRLLLPDGGVP